VELKETLVNSAAEIFLTYGMKLIFVGDSEQTQFISANQVNILTGMNGGLRGNILIGLNKTAASGILFKMKNIENPDSLEYSTESVMCKLSKLILNKAVEKAPELNALMFSPPTVIIGQQLFLVLSRYKSTKLSFKIDNEIFSISYSLE
jgi:chemotaxis protein CheX